MSNMKKLEIKASTKYPVIIASDKEYLKQSILPFIKGNNVAIISDENIDKLYSNYFDDVLCNKNVVKYIIKDGEQSKNAQNYLSILSFLESNNFERVDTIISFGGGVVGDLGGFVSSTYMRGITHILIPTTLLSMLDSSVGGKTAIDLENGKNLVGTFYQPKVVYIDTSFIISLPKSEYLCGMGEAIKYLYLSKNINESDLFGDIDNLIIKCLKIKSKIVKEDEKENNRRKLLNFGHTFAHAIESSSNYEISHGIAVVKGIKYALAISKKYYSLDDKDIERFMSITKKFGYSVDCEFQIEKLIEKIKHDKKAKNGSVDFVLYDGKKARIVNISLNELDKLI